jgi:putative GTP pyrophosphokinase
VSFVKPEYTKSEVNRAGSILANKINSSVGERSWASEVLANWRSSHAYPINTFQSTLRSKLKAIGVEALVAQRLKRTPSILLKLERFSGMQLARMQDIGGLRAVVPSMSDLRKLVSEYESTKFTHERLPPKDYIVQPKADGYRSVHMIYRYRNDRAPDYNGLSLELQIRTKLQHAWATAVETMGTYLGQALKSGQGDAEWKLFFKIASAALALLERTPAVPGFEKDNRLVVYRQLVQMEKKLNVLTRLRGFAIATDRIVTARGTGAYHLIVLDSTKRSVALTPFPMTRLEDATRAYSEIEERAKGGENIEAVLVSAGPVDALRKAYPNYFLDTQVFIDQIARFIRVTERQARY